MIAETYMYLLFPGNDCKLKWKSIRSAYIRTLNTKSKSGSGAGSKKDYYLASYLQFLNPYTKCRSQGGNIPKLTRENEQQNNDTIVCESQIEQDVYEVSDVISAHEDSLTHEVQSTSSSASYPRTSTPSVPTNEASTSYPGTSTTSVTTNQPLTSTIRKKQISEADKCAIDYFT